MIQKMLTLIHGIKQIVQICNAREISLTKDQLKTLSILSSEDQSKKFAIIIDRNGLVEELGLEEDIMPKYQDSSFHTVINAFGKCIVPGFVDSHTHPVWAGDRVHEFAMKLSGASYMDIHRVGGGINFTVDHTTEAGEEELYDSLKERLMRMLRKGTTTMECKTGYGLLWPTEEKMLRVLTKAKRRLPMDISITYLAAHAIPKGSTAAEATQSIVEEQIPKLKVLMDEGIVEVDNIDVFCEKGVFDVEQSERILKAGHSIGLHINFHADELNPVGGAELGGRLKARAASHLEEISANGIAALAASDCVGVLLPTTAYILRLKPPPARDMLDAGVTVALGSDFNPNAFCLSMPLVMHLACVLMRMTLEEALVGATLHSAKSLGLAHRLGSIEVGKQADLVILDVDRWEHLIYQLGETDTIITHVLKKGQIVYEKT